MFIKGNPLNIVCNYFQIRALNQDSVATSAGSAAIFQRATNADIHTVIHNRQKRPKTACIKMYSRKVIAANINQNSS